MPHDAGDGVFVIGEHRAAIGTGWFGAMMAGSGDGLQIGLLPRADEQSHVAPALAIIESIQRMTGCHAGFAAGAGIEIDLKGILLPRIRLRERNEMREALADGFGVVFVGEQSDRRAERLLLTKQLLIDDAMQRFRVGPPDDCEQS